MPCPDGLTAGFAPELLSPTTICQVVARFGRNANGTDRLEFGTGMLFFSRNESSYVVTAAHTIWSPLLGRYCDSAQLNFGRVGSSVPVTRSAANWWAPEAFMASDNADPEWDFGVFRVKKLVGVAPIALFRSIPPFAPAATVCGYPNEGVCAGQGRSAHASSALTEQGAGNFGYAALASYEGMSGAPLLMTHKAQPVSLGVHVRGPDPGEPRRAVRFVPRNLAIIGGWLGESL